MSACKPYDCREMWAHRRAHPEAYPQRCARQCEPGLGECRSCESVRLWFWYVGQQGGLQEVEQ